MKLVCETSEAKEFGFLAAVLLNKFRYWITANTEQELGQIDGETWAYCSVESLGEFLGGVFSTQQIRTALKKLLESKAIVQCQLKSANRTLYYRLTEITNAIVADNKSICCEQQIHLLKTTNPIIDNNKGDNKEKIITRERARVVKSLTEQAEKELVESKIEIPDEYRTQLQKLSPRLFGMPAFRDRWEAWLRMRIAMKKPVRFSLAASYIDELDKHPDPYEPVHMSVKNRWEGIFPKRYGHEKSRSGKGYGSAMIGPGGVRL